MSDEKNNNNLKVVINGEISSFSPLSIDENIRTLITCSSPPLSASRSLRASGAAFISQDGGEDYAGVVTINDKVRYTSFLVDADAMKKGKYQIVIILVDGRTEYRLTSVTDLTVEADEHISISGIQPNSVKASELAGTTFSISGSGLNKIQTGLGFYLRTQDHKFQYASALTEMSVRVRYKASSPTPEPGSYKVLAKNSIGSIVSSQANLLIEED